MIRHIAIVLVTERIASMKKLLPLVSMVLLLAPALQAADKIRIGFPEFNSSTFTLPMAHPKGFFQEEGLQAELIRIRSAIALPSLTSGEIDYHTVVAPAVTAALRGIPVRVVACFTPGLSSVSIRVMNAVNLECEADCFDAVLCRLALMLFNNPAGALSEMYLVAKPSGKVVVMVFSTPESNSYHGLPLQTDRSVGKLPSPIFGQPEMFALSGTGVLEALFRNAGFQDIAIHAGQIRRKFTSLAATI